MPINQKWNVTLDDSSPVFTYLPYGDGAASAGWATYYSVSGFRQAGGNTPLGDSSHVTWNNDTTLSLSFYGNALYLYGGANCTYDLALDGQQYPTYSPTNDGQLAVLEDLAEGQHSVTLKPHPGGSKGSAFSFDKAVVTLTAPSGNPGKADVYDNGNSSISYLGSWAQVNDKSIPSTTAPAPYRQTKVTGSAASLEFQGQAVMISGPLNWGHWLYTVTLDDGPATTYNASAWWIIGDTPLYFQGGLDPSKVHKVTIADVGKDPNLSTISLNSFTVFGTNSSTVPDSSSSASGVSSSGSASTGTSNQSDTHPVPAGTIAGAAVAATLVLVALIAGLFVYLRRRRQHRDQYPARGDRDPNGIDELKSDSNEGYVSEPFLSSGSSITLSRFQQPPAGYVARPSKGGSVVIEPEIMYVGQFYQQQQQRGSQAHIPSEAGAPQSTTGHDESERSEHPPVAPVNNQGPVLDYDLLAEHVVARLPRAVDGGELNPPEYMPPRSNQI
ncbi:hypothetical protein BDV93DRAFT_547778 [Ceratobasidium sp. AG-I]|nr:hypothetical protein BDV93DRAFT_547778 [Ceratobasidium sp. AG-I]